MISLRLIRKRFRDGERDVEVLHDLVLEVARGEFTAVVGASGSGKSTLLYIAGALDADFEGDAVVAGRNLRDLDARQRAAFRNESVGFVFQSFNLLPALPAVENVLLPGLFVPGVSRRPPSPSFAPGPSRPSTGSASPTRPPASPESSPEGSGSGSPSPGRCSRAPRCCWPTSPPATSTPGAARRS